MRDAGRLRCFRGQLLPHSYQVSTQAAGALSPWEVNELVIDVMAPTCMLVQDIESWPSAYTTNMLPVQVEALCNVPWGQLQVIPYYARIAATLNPVFPELAAGAAHVCWIACCKSFAPVPACFPSSTNMCTSAISNQMLLSTGIMSKLEANFRGQQRHKDASGRTLESRLRTSRYLGERR